MTPMCGIGEDEQKAVAWQRRVHPEPAQETTATATTTKTKQKRTGPKAEQLPMRQVGQHGPSTDEGKTYPAAPAMSPSGPNAEQTKTQAQASSTAIHADQPTALPSQTGSAASTEGVGVEKPPSGTGSRNIAAQGVSEDLRKTETGLQAPSVSRDISRPDDGVKESSMHRKDASPGNARQDIGSSSNVHDARERELISVLEGDAPQAAANDQSFGVTASQRPTQAAAMPRAIDDILQDLSKDEQHVKQGNAIRPDKDIPNDTSEQVDRSEQGVQESTGLLDKVKTALGVGGIAAVGTVVAGTALAGHKKEDNETMEPDKTANYAVPVADNKPGDSGSGTEYAKDTGRADPNATVSNMSQDKGSSGGPTARDEMDELGITEPIEKQPDPNVGYRTFNNGLDYGDTNNDLLKPKGEVIEQEDPLICTQHIEANAPQGGSMNYGSTGNNLTGVSHKHELGTGVGILAATAGVTGAAAYEGNRSKVKELERTKDASSSDQLSPSVTSDSDVITSGHRGAMQSDSMDYSSTGSENMPKGQLLDENETTTGPALGEEQREPGTLDSSMDATILPHAEEDLSPGMLTYINFGQDADEERYFDQSIDSQTQTQMPSSKDNADNSFGTTQESESLNEDDQQSIDHPARNAALLAGGAAGGTTLAAIPVAFGKTKSESTAYTGDTGKFAEAQAVEPMDSSDKVATKIGGFPENIENKSNTLSQAQIPSRLQSTTAADAAGLSNAEEYEALPSDTFLNPDLELPFNKSNAKQVTADAPIAGDFSMPSQGYTEKGDLRDLATRRSLNTTEEPDTNPRAEESGLKEARTVSGPQKKAIQDPLAESQGSMVEEDPLGAQKASGAAIGVVGAGAGTAIATLGLYDPSRRSPSPVKGASTTDTSTHEATNAPSKIIHGSPQARLSADDEASYPDSAYMTPSTHYEGDDGSIEQSDDDSFRDLSSALDQMNISRPLGIQAERMPGGYTSSLTGYPETPEAVIKQNVRKMSTTVEETPDTEYEPLKGDDDDEYEPINFARSDSIIGVPEPLKGSKPNFYGVVTDEPTPKAPRSPQLQAADKLNVYPSPSPRMSPSPILRNKTPVKGPLRIPAAVESVAAEQEVVRGQATINTQTTPEVSQDGQEQTHQVQASQMSITGAGPDLTNGNLGTVTQQDEVTQGESQRGTQRPCDQNNVNLPMQSQNGEERLRTDTYRIPPDTVSGYLASQGPGMEQNPGAALKEMGVKRERPNLFRRFIDHLPYRREKLQEYISEYEPTAEELEVLANDPRFPYRPSDLFLKIYATMVRSLEQDILGGVVSPELMSGSGVVTHTVFGSIPEIMSHCAKAIEHAEEEVIIATAYWQKGDSVNKVRDALIELNRKASERTAKGGSEKVIVKILYDRSHFVKKMVTPGYRIKIDPSEHTSIDLPDVKDVPNLSIEIVDYHRPFLGTLHTKYIILDRKIAFLMSNNIQDRPNLEFCMQLEGPIVDSLYDMFLISWDRPFDPPLPKINKPAGNWPEDTFGFVDQPNTLG
ncbi:hypothetical protein BZG36_05027, partial [Bifiguratus adelaidae]